MPQRTVLIKNQEEQQMESPVERELRTIARYKLRIKSPKTAIRSHCVECMGGQIAEVSRCTNKNCSLYPFRMGKNPFYRIKKEKD